MRKDGILLVLGLDCCSAQNSAELGCLCTVNGTLGKGCYFFGPQESLIDGA